MAEHDKHKDKYDFFVDGKKIENDKSSLTGEQIKRLVLGLDVTYALYLEAHGNDPDKQIQDSDTVSLGHEGHGGPKRFYTVPPATFGADASAR